MAVKYTNSPLVNYTRISPNKTSPRNHIIDTITIHCVVGQCTVEALGAVFAPATRKGSSNYGVGKDGKIGMYVEEKDRSWCSSNADNDHRAITIEVASDTTHPYAVTDAAYKALIELVTDICKRNNIKKLVWSTNKDDRVNHRNGCNMTVHRDYANKACPGEYLYSRHGDIAEEVNKRLGVKNTVSSSSTVNNKTLYRIQVGAFSNTTKAKSYLEKVKKAGFDAFIIKVGNLYKIQVGAFGVKSKAESFMKKVKSAGFNAFLTTESGEIITSIKSNTDEIKVGDKVKLKSNAYVYGTKTKFASFVYNSALYVRQINGDKVVISTQKTGAVTGTVSKNDLTKI